MPSLTEWAQIIFADKTGKLGGDKSKALAELRGRAADVGQTLSSYIEPALTMGTGMAGQAVGGLAGIGGLALGAGSGRNVDAAANITKNVADWMTYKPRTAGGQKGLEVVGGIGENIAKRVNTAAGIGSGLATYQATGDIEQATNVGKEVYEKGPSQAGGDYVLDKTGSPLLATGAAMIGPVVDAVAGTKLAGKIPGKQFEASGIGGQKFGQAGAITGAVEEGNQRLFRGTTGQPNTAGITWTTPSKEFASEYAEFQGGNLTGAPFVEGIDAAIKAPVKFRHAEQRKPISEFLSDITSQMDDAGLDFIDEGLAETQFKSIKSKFGKTEEINKYWQDKEVTEFMENAGFDSIAVPEGGANGPMTYGLIDNAIKSDIPAQPNGVNQSTGGGIPERMFRGDSEIRPELGGTKEDYNLDTGQFEQIPNRAWYFTPDSNVAKKYGEVGEYNIGAKNPLITDNQSLVESIRSFPEKIDDLMSQGYDSIYYKPSSGWGNDKPQLAIFDPKAAKLINNKE